MHLQPFFKDYDYISLNEDVSKGLFEQGVCLPSGSNLTNEEVYLVCNTIKEYFKTL